jgi:hypothetical protein
VRSTLSMLIRTCLLGQKLMAGRQATQFARRLSDEPAASMSWSISLLIRAVGAFIEGHFAPKNIFTMSALAPAIEAARATIRATVAKHGGQIRSSDNWKPTHYPCCNQLVQRGVQMLQCR